MASWVKGWAQGQPSEKRFITLKAPLQFIKKNRCILGYNCCQTGMELSKCVYLAFMGVKINFTVGGQNKEIFKMHI